MPCVSPLAGFVNKETGGIVFKRSKVAGAPMKVACYQCIGCRTDRRKQWAARISHEAAQYDQNSFITLTYRDPDTATDQQIRQGKYLPSDKSLHPSHLQKFFKRLRKKFPKRRIRYYACGEYGDENNRPHYHACLFNLCFDDEELYSENHGNPLFTSQTLEKLWGYGFAVIGNLTFESASYVAGYVLKKITGTQAHDHYLRYDEFGNPYWLHPEYATMSLGRKKGDGIGATWFKRYHEDVFPSDDLPVPGLGVVRGVPRYYEEIYADMDAAGMEQVKEIRKQFAISHPELYTPERLNSQYKIYKANQRKREL